MVHQEQPVPPDSRPNVPRQRTPRVGITESLIAPGEVAEGVVVRRSSTEDLFAALGLAGQAAGVLGEQARFVIHQQRGVAIRQAKEELPGLLQDIQSREMVMPNEADPGEHSRAIVDQRIRGSGMSKAAAQAYRDVLVPGLATGFVQEQQRMKNEQESTSMLFYKDALLQAADAQEVGDILDEMGRELPDVPEAILLGILAEAGTAAANNGDMTRVDAIRAVLGDRFIDQQQKMLRTLQAVNSQRERARRQDNAIRQDDLDGQLELGMPMEAAIEIMQLWVANPTIDFSQDEKDLAVGDMLVRRSAILANAGDAAGVEQAMRLSENTSTTNRLIPLLIEAEGTADVVARRELEEILAQIYVQVDDGAASFDDVEKEIDVLATDPRLDKPSTWQDRQLTRLAQRRAGEDAKLFRQDLERQKQEKLNSAVSIAVEALNDRGDNTNATNTPDLVYTNLAGKQITVPSEDIVDAAYKIRLDAIQEQHPDSTAERPLVLTAEQEILAETDPDFARTTEQASIEAERFRLRLEWLVKTRHVDKDFAALLEAGANEDFTAIPAAEVAPLATNAFELWKELDAVGLSNTYTSTGNQAFFREARFAQVILGKTAPEALIAAGKPDRVIATSPDGKARISDRAIDKALKSSVVGSAVDRDTDARAVLVNIASFHMLKYGTAEEFALKEGVGILDDDYMPLNGYLFRKRGINLSEGNIELVGDLLIDFYRDDEKNAEIYDKDMLTLRHNETTGEIFVTRFNTGVPVENSPTISIREMGMLAQKHLQATDKSEAKIFRHKLLASEVEEQMNRVKLRHEFYSTGDANESDPISVTRAKGKPGRLFLPPDQWRIIFTDVTEQAPHTTISEAFDPTMPEGTRPVVVDIINFIGQNQKKAVRRATTVPAIPPRRLPGPRPIPVPPGFQN